MSDGTDIMEAMGESIKEKVMKKMPDDIGDIAAADVMKEPEEADHQAECHLLKGPQGEDTKIEERNGATSRGDTLAEAKKHEEKEKGELDSAAESEDKKDEDEGWLYVLGHNLLKKRVIKKGGDMSTRPINGQVVTIRYKGRLYQQDDKVVDSSSRYTFTLGDGDVTMAFDLCVALMCLGEVCEVVTDAKYAYGASGKQPSVPANASLHYELELLSVEDAPKTSDLSPVVRANKANEKRERGNILYARGEYSPAITAYSKALDFVDTQYDVDVTDQSHIHLVQDMRLKCYNNLAAAQLKLEAWDAAIKSTNQVLRVQPQNVKALFRKGKCLSGKGDTAQAISVLREALALEPETKERGYKIIHQELSRLVSKQRKQEEAQRQMYQRMIGADTNPATAQKGRMAFNAQNMLTLGALFTGLVAVGLGMYRFLHD